MLGAVLWTIGLLTCVTILFTFSARARDSMIIVHSQTHTSMVVAIAAMLAGLFLVRRAIAPFERIRARLGEVRADALEWRNRAANTPAKCNRWSTI